MPASREMMGESRMRRTRRGKRRRRIRRKRKNTRRSPQEPEREHVPRDARSWATGAASEPRQHIPGAARIHETPPSSCEVKGCGLGQNGYGCVTFLLFIFTRTHAQLAEANTTLFTGGDSHLPSPFLPRASPSLRNLRTPPETSPPHSSTPFRVSSRTSPTSALLQKPPPPLFHTIQHFLPNLRYPPILPRTSALFPEPP